MLQPWILTAATSFALDRRPEPFEVLVRTHAIGLATPSEVGRDGVVSAAVEWLVPP